MAISKNDSKEQIEILVENFDNHINEYKKGNYNETLTRRDFIDPFLSSLGWDVDNKLNLPGSYREVIHEDKLIIDDSSRAPDYCITINGNKKFYVEAKKPSVSLKDSISAAYQLRRYGWSAKLPISIITDFEEFSIYDCQVRPNADDKASIARINYFTYQDYIKEFDFLWETFSKESVKNGSLEKYFQSTKGKRASTSVDDEFLKSLDSWRDLLARNLVFKNPSINEDQLNFSLQKIIDRIIFLRISEDRGVEDQNQLLKSIGNNTYNNLKTLFHLADRKYNSGLFDYKKDEITDSLVIDDNILGQIIEEMYYPKSPYEFSVIPVEILGHSYEQYLGKTITIEPNHAIKIEEKPEVRKAGGVYYTPQYIVDYIVQNTVGKLVEGKKPEDVAKLKICDPACGSGSFLLGAYQYLLDWHREYYNNAKLKNKDKFITPDGNLTTSLKKEILLNNIFGVDIDTNAVEVTKLSLMLKAMEGETKASINHQLSAFHDRVLPTLDQNIKSGNSLISSDFYIDNRPSLFNEREKRKINTFDWEKEFPTIFKVANFDKSQNLKKQIKTHINAASNYIEGAKYHVGKANQYIDELVDQIVKEETISYHASGNSGFDVIIGNPPYVDYRAIDDNQKQYLIDKYFSTKVKEKWSLFIPFLEKSSQLLNENGKFGFIIPNNFLVSDFGFGIRKYLLKNVHINRIIDVSNFKVFGNVSTYPVLFFFQKPMTNNSIVEISYPINISDLYTDKFNLIKTNEVNQERNKYQISTSFSISSINILDSIEKRTTKLGMLCDKFIWGTSITGFKNFKIKENDYNELNQLDKNKYQRVIQTADIKRYCIEWQSEYIDKSIYSSSVIKEFNKHKIVIARVTKKIQAALDNEYYYLGKSSLLTGIKINEKYLLALLNSKLLNYYYNIKYENTHMSGGYLRFDIPYLKELPIRIIDFTNKTDKSIHDKLIDLVEQMLENKKYLIESHSEKDKKIYSNICDTFDKKIDQLVYELYELTEEEIKVVEGNN